MQADLPMDIKISGHMVEKRILILSQSIYSKIFINYKGTNSKFTLEKLSRHHLNQVIRAKITSNKTYWYHAPWYKWEEYITSFIFAKNAKPQSSLEKTSKSNWRTFYKITDQKCSKVSRTRETSKDRRIVPSLGETKDIWQLNSGGILGWILEQKKKHS